MALTPQQKKKRRNKRLALGIGFLVIAGFVAYGIYWSVTNPQSPFVTTPTPSEVSTFQLFSKVDGEDVSDFVEISVWIPDDDAEFDETEDIFTISNFEEDKSSMDAEDVEIDLSGVEYAWLEIDPDSEVLFAEDWILLYGGANYDYKVYVYDQSTDVNFNILDEDTMAGVTVGDLAMSGGYLAVIDVPHATETAAQLHVGTNWDMEQSEFDDLTDSEKADYYDEKNWAGQYPTYNPADDLEKKYDDDLEQLTDAFALKFTFNTTVSTTDGATTQVNCTMESGAPVDVVYSGTFIYMIFYEALEFENGAQDVYFDMDTADDIHVDNVHSGRLVVPRDDDSLGAFTAYSAIGA